MNVSLRKSKELTLETLKYQTTSNEALSMHLSPSNRLLAVLQNNAKITIYDLMTNSSKTIEHSYVS